MVRWGPMVSEQPYSCAQVRVHETALNQAVKSAYFLLLWLVNCYNLPTDDWICQNKTFVTCYLWASAELPGNAAVEVAPSVITVLLVWPKWRGTLRSEAKRAVVSFRWQNPWLMERQWMCWCNWGQPVWSCPRFEPATQQQHQTGSQVR